MTMFLTILVLKTNRNYKLTSTEVGDEDNDAAIIQPHITTKRITKTRTRQYFKAFSDGDFKYLLLAEPQNVIHSLSFIVLSFFLTKYSITFVAITIGR
jgi:hypothetical protein